MSLEHMLRDEQEALSFLLGEEFEMSDNFFIDNPHVVEFILKHEGERHQRELEQAWNDLQAVPSYVERQAALFCTEPTPTQED